MLALLVSSGELRPGKWRPLKRLALCHRLGWSRATVYRSLNRLREVGYLERRLGAPQPGDQGRQINLYKLVYDLTESALSHP